MKQCLKITITVTGLDSSYLSFVQKHAMELSIEGTIKVEENKNLVSMACGTSENLDKFIDYLYRGTSKSKIENLIAEPFINSKDFRGTFRIIGNYK